ncbi:MAG: 16S rRNA (cytidine(1402)-2'-O)-methyltransferase [Candidatus Gracilibacteria bacterium]|jgi:16S rRNA (cytidine1402-2'-O)-methyltransferase
MLYIVATPIGNLEDITLRALRILKEVDYIAAEDTRHVKILLDKYEIHKPTISFHAWSDERKLHELLAILSEGKSIALVSDAGTPGISDPGYVLVKAALEHKIPVTPIPGASAFLTALSASGLPINQFLYIGFLPLKKGRQTAFKALQEEKRTIVFYESPHRIIKTLGECVQYFSGRTIVIGRELTKMFEEFFRGTPEEALAYFKAKQPKGEFVIMIGAQEKGHHHEEEGDRHEKKGHRHDEEGDAE